MKPYVFHKYDLRTFAENLDELAGIYNEYGVLIFKGVMRSDPNFERFVREVEGLFDGLLTNKLGIDSCPPEVGAKLTMLASLQPLLGKIVSNLGTQHNKFFSFNKVKYSDYMEAFLRKIWGEEATIATPQAGDTLHLFPPGKSFHRYNLPPHQDYQYLMQSPQQVTIYFGISQYHEGVGGLRIWEKSHKLGVLPANKNQNGAFEVYDWENVLKNHEVADFTWSKGDFGIFDSLLSHSSIPNETADRSRIVQICRYSNLNDEVARRYDYGSTVYTRQSCDFTVEHPDLFVS